MKTSTSEGKQRVQWIDRKQLDDLDFADDLALLPHTRQQIQEKTNIGVANSTAVGLNIHKGKNKILPYNKVYNNRLTIDGDLEDVKIFTYLGSIIDEHGGSDADVKARIDKTRAAYLQLENIWTSKRLSANQHQSQNFQHKCQHNSTVWSGKLENYEFYRSEDTSFY
ncbi:unnamed protein product [Schistosoma margrebowiei]|uniref:Uncharacterized protein n=1 Tax=Schistosoma margrebowiei TaxID=48269 RepID=A0A183N2E7_9TREM|nr:unnamed protein product [Schistosoma margrebowiei]